jgi:hypothetical protein
VRGVVGLRAPDIVAGLEHVRRVAGAPGPALVDDGVAALRARNNIARSSD